jgi:hypothetical protein
MTDPHYKALLIGNSVYERDPHQLPPLKGPGNDLALLKSALLHPEAGVFEAANIETVHNGTKAEIGEAIEGFFTSAGPKDHLLFYYSGHGYNDLHNNLFLCARDTRTSLLVSSAISDKVINLMATNSRALKVIFVLDCCHSGSFKGGANNSLLAHGSGRCLITSCASHQLSKDASTPTGASVFTHFLAEALSSGEVDSDGDGIVLTSEVFKYVQPRVYNASQQTVQWTMDKTFGEAALARAKPRNTPVPPPPPLKTPPGRPLLEVSESRIEFLQVEQGERLPVERIDVYNIGEGALNWMHECDEDWIRIERREDLLYVTLDTRNAGTKRGNIFVRDQGRGGSKTIRVLLKVLPGTTPNAEDKTTPTDSSLPPEGPDFAAINDAFAQALLGWWTNDAGAFCVKIEDSGIHYTDHNLMGIKVGTGMIRIENGRAFVQGQNNFIGPYTGEIGIQGMMLSGSIFSQTGQQFPLMFVRNRPWFAAFH